MCFHKFYLCIILVQGYFLINCYPQNNHPTIVRGLISDSETNESLPLVYIMFLNSTIATIADNDGVFTIQTNDTSSYLKITFVGYKTSLVKVMSGKNQFIHVFLKPESKELSEVIVTGRKKRYRNRGNPAVEIIDSVISHKSQNRLESIDYLEVEKYQKILFSFDTISPKIENNKLLRPFHFVLDNMDSLIIPGKKLIPIYLKETISHYYFRKNPHGVKEILDAEKFVSFDDYLDRKTMSEAVNYLYLDINIYNNTITLFSNQFLSPIASLAPAFYKFFIRDTVYIDSLKCVQLNFEPRNPNDFMFQGKLYIALDSSYAVKRITMDVNKNINMNWIKSIAIDQEFQKNGSIWILSRNNMNVDFGVAKNSFGLFGQKTVVYNHYVINSIQNDTIFRFNPNNIYIIPPEQGASYWQQSRPFPLRQSEQNVYFLMDSLKKNPAFRRDMNFISLLSLGFETLGYVEIGPTTTLFSQNPIEGSRIRIGIRTTRKFNKKLFLETYGAYGSVDEQFKSYFHGVYSLNDKSVRESPLKSISVSYQDDLRIPGQELQYVQADNLLLSFKRGVNDKMFFDKHVTLENLNEFENHFSYKLKFENSQIRPLGNLYFSAKNNLNSTIYTNNITIAQISADFRYAPNEKFVQGSLYRVYFPNKYPVMEVIFTAGAKKLGSNYNFQKIQTTISKRFNESLLGYTDLEIEAGIIFGHVPYPLLYIHRANQSYSYQPLSYNLMNFLEFVSDQYMALNLDHNFNGFFFNKVPLFKKLKFRESLTFKALYGMLHQANNPENQNGLFQLPTDYNRNPLTFTLEKKPYMEAGFGVTNIFKFFRIDYIFRLSYLNHPNVSPSGFRFDYKFEF